MDGRTLGYRGSHPFIDNTYRYFGFFVESHILSHLNVSAFPSEYMQPLHTEKIMSIQKILIYLSLSLSIACQETESKSQSNPVSPELEAESTIGFLEDAPIIFLNSDAEDLDSESTIGFLENAPIIFIDGETEGEDEEVYDDEEFEVEEQYDDEEFEGDSIEYFNCSLVFPEDSLEAAVYSFVAEYALSMPFAVGCYSSVYPQSSFIGTVYEIEQEWFYIGGSKQEALEYAQDWVDYYFESFDRDTIDIIEAFQITVDEHGVSGGFGYQ